MRCIDNSIRVAVAVGMLALATAAGCGDSGDDPASAENGQTQEISRVFDQFQDAFIAVDGKAVCATLSASGQQEFVALGKTLGVTGVDSCAAAVDIIAARTKAAGTEQKLGVIVSAKVSGDRARAMMRDAGRPPVPVPFVRDGGVWKLDSAGIGNSAGGR
jgi:hypothetical protein